MDNMISEKDITMLSKKKYFIKERSLEGGEKYFIACGSMEVVEAELSREAEGGEVKLHLYETREAYSRRLKELRDGGERVVW